MAFADRRTGVVARQQDRDFCPLSDFACNLDRPAGLMRETMDLRKSKPRALADRLGGEERVEYPAPPGRRDADPGVRDRKGDAAARARLLVERIVVRGDRNDAASRHRVARIDDE